MSGLTLTYGGITLNLDRFTGRNWPRKRIETPEISRTTNNTPLLRGYNFEAPHIWQVSAIVDDTAIRPTDADRMNAIYDLWQQDGGDITLDDETRDFVETSPRTRAIVSGGSETTIVTGKIAYPARFNVRFNGQLTMEGQGPDVVFNFQLIETGVVAA